MAAETHGGGPPDETLRISPETRERLQGWGGAERRDDELLQDLLDEVERGSDTATWPASDYY